MLDNDIFMQVTNLSREPDFHEGKKQILKRLKNFMRVKSLTHAGICNHRYKMKHNFRQHATSFYRDATYLCEHAS